jgi:hypothetical protein
MAFSRGNLTGMERGAAGVLSHTSELRDYPHDRLFVLRLSMR